MTPPIPPLQLKIPDFELEIPRSELSFFPALHLELDIPKTLPPPRFQLLEYPLSWKAPTMWHNMGLPLFAQASSPPSNSSPPVSTSSSGWSGTQILQFITDILLLVETLDAKGSHMTSNGGEGGCRYEEMAKREEVPNLLDKCLVKFEPDTHATVDLQIRKMEGSLTESLITIFKLRYNQNIYKDEFPDNQVRVQGFQFSPTPQKPIPFDVSVSPLTQMGYSIRYMVEPAGLMKIPFLGYPIFKLEAEPHPKLDLTKDFFLALGIDQADYYREVQTDPFKSPQTVRGFMKLMEHIEGDDDKLQVVNINKLKGRPPLFDWLSFERIDWVSRLREGNLFFPDFGTFTFSRKKAFEKIAQTEDPKTKRAILDQTARLEVHGSQKRLDVSLGNIEVSEAHFKVGDQEVTLRGMSAEKIKTNVPGIKELIRQIKAGIFGLDKLHLEAENLFVEELIIRDHKNKITTHLKNAHLAHFIFNGSSDISATSIRADLMNIESKKLNMGFHIENAVIPSTHFGRKNGKEEIFIPQLEGGKTQIRYSNTALEANKSVFENLRWTENGNKSLLAIETLSSSGSISYKTPSGISFETSGSSKLQRIQLEYLKSGQVNASLELSGKVGHLHFNQDASMDLHLNEAEFNPSKLNIELKVNPETNKIEGMNYHCDLNIKNTAFGQSHLGPITLAASSLREGRLQLVQKKWNLLELPSIDLTGLLDIHLQSISGQNESFNIPGLSVTGGIYGVDLTGPAHFTTTESGWIFERLDTPSHDKLRARGQIREVEFLHDPHKVPGNTLKQWPHNEVVKTDMKFKSADLSVEEIEKIEFIYGSSSTESENHLRHMDLRRIRFDNIQASGVAWAKFPLFYYMRGVFPEIGTRYQESLTTPSFLSLDRFSILRNPDEKSLTTFEGFRAEVFEVGGKEQFAKMTIPLLIVSPQGENLVDTGNNLTEIELYLIDKARGGYIRLQSVPRPLDKRRSRMVVPPSEPRSKPQESVPVRQ